MFNNSSIIVGLEVGTTKIVVVVGELPEDGPLSIVGCGQSESRGICKGEIVDRSAVETAVRQAIEIAERESNVEIRSVILAVSGGHVRSFDNRGVVRIEPASREITTEDIHEVIQRASAYNLPTDRQVLHRFRQNFSVDQFSGVENPLGMVGERIEADVHVLHGDSSRIGHAVRLIEGMHLQVEECVVAAHASALGVLSMDQRSAGALVIDIGGGTTDYSVFLNGIQRHAGVLPVGGQHLTNDVALGLGLTQTQAERMKREYGTLLEDASLAGRQVSLSGEYGLNVKLVRLAFLSKILRVRMEEIFQIVRQELTDRGVIDRLCGEVVLTGGSARLVGADQLAHQIFGLPARLGHITENHGVEAILESPEFSTAVGLVKHGAWKLRQEQSPAANRSLLQKIKSYLATFI